MESNKLSAQEIGEIFQRYFRKRFNLRPTAGSGNVRADGDEIGSEFSVELKGTGKSSISIKLEIWDKIVQEAQSHGKMPLYVAGFVDDSTGKVKKCLCITTPEYLEEVLHPAKYVQEKIVDVNSTILREHGVSEDIIAKVEENVYDIWESGKNTL